MCKNRMIMCRRQLVHHDDDAVIVRYRNQDRGYIKMAGPWRSRQFMLQEPGPRGSPQDPQADGWLAVRGRTGDPCDTANTDSCLSSASDWHSGHFAWREALTMASNGC